MLKFFVNIEYIWLIWSCVLLFVWFLVYVSIKNEKSKKEMLIVSFFTALFALSSPFFTPEYWSPPSLFNLSERTGFDIESFVFSFAIGGLAVSLYERIFKIKHEGMEIEKRYALKHKYHIFALIFGPVIFFALFFLSDLNSIYSVSIAFLAGGLLNLYFRLDLKKKMIASAFLFLGLYFVYFLTLEQMYPGYVEKVWNLSVISGVLVLGIPLEELMFAFAFGFYWSGLYEFITWRRIKKIK